MNMVTIYFPSSTRNILTWNIATAALRAVAARWSEGACGEMTASPFHPHSRSTASRCGLEYTVTVFEPRTPDHDTDLRTNIFKFEEI